MSIFGGISSAEMAAFALIASAVLAFSFFLVSGTGAAVDEEIVMDVEMVDDPQLLLAAFK